MDYDIYYDYEDNSGCFKVILIILVISLVCGYFAGRQKQQYSTSEETSAAAIAVADTIELNKKYKDKTNKNDKTHINYKAYIFEIDEAGQVGVEYKCKKTWVSRANIVKWEIIDLETGEKIHKSQYHSFDVEMIAVHPGKYAIQFQSISNELSLDLFHRKYNFKVVYEK